jgi:hypothetical protein
MPGIDNRYGDVVSGTHRRYSIDDGRRNMEAAAGHYGAGTGASDAGANGELASPTLSAQRKGSVLGIILPDVRHAVVPPSCAFMHAHIHAVSHTCLQAILHASYACIHAYTQNSKKKM